MFEFRNVDNFNQNVNFLTIYDGKGISRVRYIQSSMSIALEPFREVQVVLAGVGVYLGHFERLQTAYNNKPCRYF